MATNLQMFKDACNRVMGGIPGLAARANTRLADNKDIEALPGAILNHPVKWYGFDGKTQPEGARNTVSLAAFIGWIDSGIGSLSTGLGEIKGGIDALTVAVRALTEKQSGIDQGKLDEMMAEAARKALGTYELRRVEDEK